MEMLEDPSTRREVLELLKLEYETEKPCPHLTELIYCLRRSYFNRTAPLPPNDREILLFALGFGLERLLLASERKVVSGEKDGVSFSPDFLSFRAVFGELKTTRISANKMSQGVLGLPETWRIQILGYMHCLEVTEYSLTILFLMGNYKPPFPEIMSYMLVASQDELVSNWAYILRRRDIYMEGLRVGSPPEARVNCYDWECKDCSYSLRC